MEKNIGTKIREIYMYRDRPEAKRALADFYWRILLCSAFFIIIMSIAYGFFRLISVLRDPGVSSANAYPVQPPPALNRAKLQGALNEFRAREDRFESLKTNASTVADPSI